MRGALALLIALVWLAPALAAPSRPAEVVSAETALRWINTYRTKPDADAVPGLMRFLSERGAFRDPDSAGVYT
ncbi:MAG: hypothetical protein M3158_00885, partial [Pseudomonadota bacterium]|nr:hypothetical protein [Pseudomonadota bacterium]